MSGEHVYAEVNIVTVCSRCGRPFAATDWRAQADVLAEALRDVIDAEQDARQQRLYRGLARRDRRVDALTNARRVLSEYDQQRGKT